VTAPKTVGVAIIGGGLMGREMAATIARWPALIDHPVVPELRGVCDINPAALNWFEALPTVELTTTDYRELLSSDRIDVVYVAVRHDLHASIYSDVVRAGKSLFAEKPFGIDGAAADEILAALADHPESFVRCSSEMPFFPGAQAAIDYVRSGALGEIVEARCGFLHASDVDRSKPLNWKRQAAFCGEAGVMNDLGLHAWHVPLRLGWDPSSVLGLLQNIVTERPGTDGAPAPCDTWDNAVVHALVPQASGTDFPLSIETKRIAPGQKNTWFFEAIGMDGGVRFSTKTPKSIEVFSVTDIPGIGREQGWNQIDAGSQSVWPTVTGGNFESGFSDAILQMWAAFLAEREGALGERFGTVRPEEARRTHALYSAAIASNSTGSFEPV